MWIDMGIDLAATRLAAVITDDQNTVRVETRTMPTDKVERAYAAFKWAFRIVREQVHAGQVAVYVEEPAFGRGGANGTLPVAMIQGAIYAGAMAAGATIVVGVNNSTWKKQIVGYGRASKTDIGIHIKKTWPALYVKAKGSQDVYDAACINLYGRTIRAMKLRVAALKAKKEARGDLPSVQKSRARRTAA